MPSKCWNGILYYAFLLQSPKRQHCADRSFLGKVSTTATVNNLSSHFSFKTFLILADQHSTLVWGLYSKLLKGKTSKRNHLFWHKKLRDEIDARKLKLLQKEKKRVAAGIGTEKNNEKITRDTFCTGNMAQTKYDAKLCQCCHCGNFYLIFWLTPFVARKIVQQWKLGVMPYFPDLTDDPVAKNGKVWKVCEWCPAQCGWVREKFPTFSFGSSATFLTFTNCRQLI